MIVLPQAVLLEQRSLAICIVQAAEIRSILVS